MERAHTDGTAISNWRSAIALRAGVELLVDRADAFGIDVGIDLRRRDIRVSEHFLHASEIRTVDEQLRREGVSQRMRADLRADRCPLDVLADESVDILADHRPA